MKIHEYQAKAILSRYGVTTPRGEVAFTKEEAREASQRLKSHITVVKAQIHAGGWPVPPTKLPISRARFSA